MSYGKYIKKARKESGWTIDEIAAATGLDRQTIYSFQSERRNPSLKTIIALADFFGVSIDTLVGHKVKGEDDGEAD